MVTGSLIGRGHNPRRVIGSTNLTEFLVTLIISVTFVLSLGWSEMRSSVRRSDVADGSGITCVYTGIPTTTPTKDGID